MNRLRELIATFFYTGYSPVASGTAGTAGALLLAWILPESIHYGLACAAIALFVFAFGVPLGTWAEKRYGKKDPGPFVIDEVAGYFVALLRLDGAKPGLGELFVAFFLFRLFDVVKPFPARNMESIPGGWGIMLDDIFAGIYALLGVIVYRQYVLGLPL